MAGSEHDVQVEHRDKRAEVTVAGGGEEGVDGVSLGGDVGGGSWAAPHIVRRVERTVNACLFQQRDYAK
jgi:hypothetical protein